MAELRGTHYDVLGVPAGASAEDLHKAYVELARRHHPDLSGGDAASMQRINAAWQTLGDPGRRAVYDASLAALGGSAAPVAAARRPWEDDDDDPYDDLEDLRADLEDDRPIGATIVLPRWMSIVPVAVFAMSVIAFFLGVMMALPALIGLSVMAFLISCLMFVAAPFVALLASRRRWR